MNLNIPVLTVVTAIAILSYFTLQDTESLADQDSSFSIFAIPSSIYTEDLPSNALIRLSEAPTAALTTLFSFSSGERHGALGGWFCSALLAFALTLIFLGVIVTRKSSKAKERNLRNGARDASITKGGATKNHRDPLSVSYAKTIERLDAHNTDIPVNLAARLSAIYALERIAKNNRDYRCRIVKVLTGYVRQQAKGCKRYPDPQDPRHAYAQEHWSYPREDVQAVFNVLSRGASKWIKRTLGANGYLDFQFCHLNCLRFDPKGLSCDFSMSHLESANFSEATFGPSTSFIDCDLTRANLVRASIRHTHWQKARLKETKLYRANICDAHGLTTEQLAEAYDHKFTRRDPNLGCENPFPEVKESRFASAMQQLAKSVTTLFERLT